MHRREIKQRSHAQAEASLSECAVLENSNMENKNQSLGKQKEICFGPAVPCDASSGRHKVRQWWPRAEGRPAASPSSWVATRPGCARACRESRDRPRWQGCMPGRTSDARPPTERGRRPRPAVTVAECSAPAPSPAVLPRALARSRPPQTWIWHNTRHGYCLKS